jgi:hypothetical protein
VCDAQLLSDRAQIEVAPLERERGRPSHDLNALDSGEVVQELLGQTIGEILIFRIIAQVHERQHGDRRAGAGCLCGRSCSRRRSYWRVSASLVQPKDPAAHQQEKREDRELRSRQALLATIAVVPGDDEGDGKTDQQRERAELLDLAGPVEGIAEVRETLQNPPRTSGIGDAPLNHLAATQLGPGAFTPTPGRRVGHWPPPEA